ncbi:MAG TPA: AAA family ATPase [Steroidobacteraceae bacterium]|nr:AAA family ATPase [Steroidobacteraceae bacterium]
MPAIDKLEGILASSENFLQKMHELGAEPNLRKVLQRVFSPGEAAEMVGRDRTTLARAEAEIGMPPPVRNPGNNRRVGYSLEQIQAFRKHFGTLPWRDPASDPPLVIACQNFKGGVGKSTTCVNFAHYLALKGYRVLVIDTDSQATTTSMFGYLPDAEITEADTMLPYLDGEQKTLHYAIRKTYFPNLDFIPACLALYEAELSIVMRISRQQSRDQAVAFFNELRYGIQTIADDYDLILVDSPPALGMISINVLLAADALLVPSAARMFDFSSTVQFFRMIQNYIGQIDPTKSYRWISVLTTLFDRRYESQKQFFEVMRACFGDSVFQRVFFHSSAVINAAAQFTTPYEQAKPDRAVLAMMSAVFEEVELSILREWPSKAGALSQRGIT